MGANSVTLIPMEQTKEEQRLQEALKKLKRYDSDIITHLEQLANLAERNKPLFNLGLAFLKRR